MKKNSFFLLLILICSNCFAQKNNATKANDGLKNESATTIQAGYDAYKKIALGIWDYAELGYKENKSTAAFVELLEGALDADHGSWDNNRNGVGRSI